MLTCREASRLLSERLDRPLRARERLALQFHLLMCIACGRAGRHFAVLRKAILRLGDEAERDRLAK
jgi:hypothetical protein